MKKMKKVFGACLSTLLVLSMVLGNVMTVNAATTEKNTVKFFVTNEEHFENGSTGYPAGEFTSDKITGQVYKFEKIFKKTIDAPSVDAKIRANVIGETPDIDDFKTLNTGVFKDMDVKAATHYIEWYVLKYTGSEWHIDGVLREKKAVTFKPENGEDDKVVLVKAGEKLELPTAPQKATVKDEEKGVITSYTFKAWVPVEGADYTTDSLGNVTKDMTFVATYDEAYQYKVTFVNGNDKTDVWVDANTVIAEADIPATDKEDADNTVFTFRAWTTEDGDADLTEAVTAPMVLTAAYTETAVLGEVFENPDKKEDDKKPESGVLGESFENPNTNNDANSADDNQIPAPTGVLGAEFGATGDFTPLFALIALVMTSGLVAVVAVRRRRDAK